MPWLMLEPLSTQALWVLGAGRGLGRAGVQPVTGRQGSGKAELPAGVCYCVFLLEGNDVRH